MSKIEEKLKSLGIELPTPAAPVANYVGFVKSGNQVSIWQGPAIKIISLLLDTDILPILISFI